MNKILEKQLYDEIYQIYCSSQDFYKVSPIFDEFKKSPAFSIVAISRLTKIFIDSKLELPNLLLYIKLSSENTYNRMRFLSFLWRKAAEEYNA